MRILLMILTLAASFWAAQPSAHATKQDSLGATDLIDTDHPSIRMTAARLTQGKTSDREKAVAIHDFVRDQIAYGFGPKFYDHRASEVLRSRRGFCNPKGTLFIALLRASGIPARQHFVEISPEILRGIVDPGTEWMDHSYTEVWLDGRWIAVDSYIVDPLLFAGARHRLQAEGLEYGYGAHRNGSLEWNGRNDNFSQFIKGNGLTNRDFGIHSDVRSFYANTPAASNRMSGQMRAFFRLATSTLNGRIHGLRAEGNALRRTMEGE